MVTASDLQTAVGLVGQSIALQQQGQNEAALRCLDQALTVVPDFPAALVKRGSVLQALCRYQEAAADFERCMARRPDMAHVRALRDAALQLALDSLDDDVPAQQAMQTWFRRAELLTRLRRDEAALDSFRRALEIDDRHIGAGNGMATLLLRLQRHDEALACYERMLAIAPDDALLLFNRGNVLQQNGRYQDALDSYAAALRHHPKFPEAQMEQAHCRLVLGQFEAGWPLFEARWETRQLRAARLKSEAPLWRGEMLDDAWLLLWAEQGLGDTLQFVRYLPLATQRAGNIVLRVQSSLKTLIAVCAEKAASASGATIWVIGNDEALPPHALQCPLMSLPLALGSTLQTIPAEFPYLQAPPASAAKWQARLGERGKPRIGLVWAGGQRLLNNPTRDMPAEALRPLLEGDAEWIGLQQSISEADRRALQGMPPFASIGDELTDFADTAGLIEQLDAVVSIDSSVAHLAGALGKPVLLMLRKSGEWRWLHGRNDTPWYPGHRLFCQQRHGEWGEVVRQVARYLDETALALI